MLFHPRAFRAPRAPIAVLIATALTVAAPWSLSSHAADMPAPGAKVAQPARPDASIDAATRHKVLETLASKMIANYVFQEIGEKMAKSLREHEKRGDYNQLASANAFGEMLTTHLQAISHDKHIRVVYSDRDVPEDTPPGARPDAAEVEQMVAHERFRNYGVGRFERLPGNIALLELNGFADPELGGEVMAGAMNLVANADALIVDLRRNGGGDPAMVALVCSYLFEGEPVHLNDLYYRRNNETRQYWTHAWVPGKRFGGSKPVYVLTSERTFSGAEEFSYNLKNLKRATLIGATTGGGANPGDMFKVDQHFAVFIPTGRAISPVTHTNWEGTGVAPDIAVPADQALLTAQILASKAVVLKMNDPQLKAMTESKIGQLQADLDKMKAAAK